MNWKFPQWIQEAGEKRDFSAVPDLLNYLQSVSTALEEAPTFAVAWALGRCQNPAALPALRQLLLSDQADSVRKMALEAIRLLSNDEERAALSARYNDALPLSMRSAQNAEGYLKAWQRLQGQGQAPELYVLYLIDDENARSALKSILTTARLGSDLLPQIRWIFKAAEYRLDAEIFALLAYRFDSELATGNEDSDTVAGKAWSIGTRIYLRRRVWHVLNRLGEAGDAAYTRMATELLLAYSAEKLNSLPNFVKEKYKLEPDSNGRWSPVLTSTFDDSGSGDGKKKANPKLVAYASSTSVKLKNNGSKAYVKFTALENEKIQVEGTNTGYGSGPSITVWDSNNTEVASRRGTYKSTNRVQFVGKEGESYLVEVKRNAYWGSEDYSVFPKPSLGSKQLPRTFIGSGSGGDYKVGEDAYAYNHVLYGKDFRYQKPGTKAFRWMAYYARTSDENRYPFAELWHNDLEALLRMLRESDAGELHSFAAPILRDYPDFCANFDDATLTDFLGAPFAATRSMALDQIFTRDLTSLEKGLQDAVDKIIPGMLAGDLDAERERALTWIGAHIKRYLKKTGVVISMITSSFSEVRSFIDNTLNTETLTEARQKKLFDALIKHIRENHPDSEPLGERLEGLLLNTFSLAAAAVDLAQSKEWIASPKACLRALGLQFFEKTDDDVLLEDEEYLHQLVSHDSEAIRQGLTNVLQRLVKKSTEFAERFCDRIVAQFTDPTFGGPAYNLHFKPSAGRKSTLSEYTLSRPRQGAPDNDGGLFELPNPTQLVGPSIDDQTCEATPIGFQFAFAGKVYNTFQADSNGWLSFSGHWGGAYSNYYAYSQNNAVGLFPWWADLKTSNDGYVRTDLIERNGEQVRVVEWRCWSYYGHSSSAGITLQFQVCLYKDSGNIEYRYKAPEVKGEPYSYYTKACGAAVDTTGQVEGNVRDFFGTNGTPAGSIGPFRTDLYDHGNQIHYPGTSNVGLSVSGGSSEALEAKYKDIVALLLKVFKPQLKKITLETAQALLGHSLHAVQGLGAELVVLNADSLDDLPEGLMAEFLNSGSPDVRGVGIKLLKQLKEEQWLADKALLLSLAVDARDDLRKGVKSILLKLGKKHSDFALELLHHLLGQSERNELNILNKMLEALDDVVLLADLALLESVSTHHNTKVREAFDYLLEKLSKEQPAQALTLAVQLLKKSHGSPNSSNDPGLKIFKDTFLGNLPLATIEENPTFLYGLCGHEREDFSKAGRAHLASLLEDDSKRQLWTDGLVAELIKREGREGRHALLMEVFREELKNPLALLSFEQVWKMLFSSSDTTKHLGAECALELNADDVSLKEITELAGHPFYSIRQKSWEMIRNSEARLKEHLEEGLRILDTEWDDSREFAFRFYRDHFGADEWTAPILVSIVDSVRSDVQQFGRDLINRYFGDEDGPEYLEKLSQHPEPNVELFVTNYLDRYARNNLERLQMLKPYFMRVLCRVNMGRAARDRVIRFLIEEAKQSEDHAQVAVEVFGWLSATHLITDKATYLEALLDIQEMYPNLNTPLQIKAVEVRTGGTPHAV